MKPYRRHEPHQTATGVALDEFIDDSYLTLADVALASRARPDASEFTRRGERRAAGFKGRFDDVVGAHPAKSVLIAAGVGALLGFLLGRRG